MTAFLILAILYGQSYGIDVFKVVEASAAPATKNYVDFLLNTATTRNSVAEILSAMTPCMRLYSFLGQGIRAALGGMPDEQHPYQRWIGSYGTEEFDVSSLKISVRVNAVLNCMVVLSFGPNDRVRLESRRVC